MGELKISSQAFNHNGMIPAKFTCKGENISPALEISGIPNGAKSLALIVDDPDAPMGTWVHWVVWNIQPIQKIDEGSVPPGSSQGITDFGKPGYGGPCPPSGTHRYFFKLYALDSVLNLPPTSKKSDLENAMKGHILEKAELVGLFSK
ncbi:MAG: YbhB/YbcL family Raf kinase inhibitor-like protein [Candidatus Micrarchaeota archaeon]